MRRQLSAVPATRNENLLKTKYRSYHVLFSNGNQDNFQHKNKRQSEGIRTPSFFSSGRTDYTGRTATFKMLDFSIVFSLLSSTMNMSVSSV